jgi:hypothetical protein
MIAFYGEKNSPAEARRHPAEAWSGRSRRQQHIVCTPREVKTGTSWAMQLDIRVPEVGTSLPQAVSKNNRSSPSREALDPRSLCELRGRDGSTLANAFRLVALPQSVKVPKRSLVA